VKTEIEQDYLANCFFRILTGQIHPTRLDELCRYLAGVVRTAQREGEWAAHTDLIGIVKWVESGEFAAPTNRPTGAGVTK